jgi:hypothetical protein
MELQRPRTLYRSIWSLERIDCHLLRCAPVGDGTKVSGFHASGLNVSMKRKREFRLVARLDAQSNELRSPLPEECRHPRRHPQWSLGNFGCRQLFSDSGNRTRQQSYIAFGIGTGFMSHAEIEHLHTNFPSGRCTLWIPSSVAILVYYREDIYLASNADSSQSWLMRTQHNDWTDKGSHSREWHGRGSVC